VVHHRGALALIIAASLGPTALRAQEKPMPGHMPPGQMGQMEAMDPEMQAMMQEMHGMMQDMMGIHAYNPARLLEKKADLSLTKEQINKLEALSTEVKTAKDHARQEHDVRHARVIAEFKLAKPDPAKVKADGQEAMNDMAAAHGTELSAAARAKGLLNDAQRAKVEASVSEHTGRH
jgi:hypothetical protein